MTSGSRLTGGIGALGLVLGLAGCDASLDRNPWGPSGSVDGSGVVVTEAWDVGNFGVVVVGGASRLVVRPGALSLTVTAEDSILPHLRAEIVGGRLVLGPRPGVHLSPTREVVYRLSCPDLQGVVLSGASHAEVAGIDVAAFLAELSGASALVASGRSDQLVVHASGASAYRGAELATRAAIVSLAAASRGTARVSDQLVADASGGSVLEYIGDPVLSVSTSGGSVVRRIGS